jgi:CDGSH-type Zn-finger protein
MPDLVTIDPRLNGPLHVKGPISLNISSGAPMVTEVQFWLCRCGGSNNKPFCDGTHKKIGFSSARLSDPTRRNTVDYVGEHLTIHDNRSICAHAGHCTAHAPSVFSAKAKPWINANADADAVTQTVATIGMCPSGALSYSIDGVRREPAGRASAIRVAKDGPYEVTGAAQLLGDAAPVAAEHYTLCRCGQSKNKPFCDGSHHAAGFRDEKN